VVRKVPELQDHAGVASLLGRRTVFTVNSPTSTGGLICRHDLSDGQVTPQHHSAEEHVSFV